MEATNLDKICAEYGMDLLNIPKKLYESANKEIKSCSNLQELKAKDYDRSELQNSLIEFLGFKLVDPLAEAKEWREKDFTKKKRSEESLEFNPKEYETEITKALVFW